MVADLGNPNKKAIFGILGGITGAGLYLLLPATTKVQLHSLYNVGGLTVNGLLGMEFWQVAFGLSLMLALVVLFFIYVVNNRSSRAVTSNAYLKALHPVFGGIFVGLLGAPLQYFFTPSSYLSSSGAFATVAYRILELINPSGSWGASMSFYMVFVYPLFQTRV